MAETFIDKDFTTFNTNIEGFEALIFVFFLFFDKNISAPFLLENLIITLSFWLESRRWQASRLLGVIETPVAVSISSHTLVSLVVSQFPTISIHYHREYWSFFQHCLFQTDNSVFEGLINRFTDCQLWFHSCVHIPVGLSAGCVTLLFNYIYIVRNIDINSSLPSFFRVAWVRTITKISQSSWLEY